MAKWVRFKYIWRPTASGLISPPATIVGYDTYRSVTKGRTHKLSQRHIDALAAKNTSHAMNYLLKAHSGWVNKIGDDGFPIIEKVAFAGNVARAPEYMNGRYLCYSLQPNAPYPSDNLEMDGWILHRFTAVNPFNQPRQPGDGFDAYIFLESDGEFWVSERDVEVFDERPEPVYPGSSMPPAQRYTTVRAGSVLYQRPGSTKILRLTKAEQYPVYGEIKGWTRIGNKLWTESRNCS